MAAIGPDINKLIECFPRIILRDEATPLEPANRLSKHLGGPQIWLKRDDYPGPPLGGNKLRKLEFFLGEAVAIGADSVITCGAVHSNHILATAAACRRLGLSCHAVLLGERPSSVEGNFFLDRLLGLNYQFLTSCLDEISPEDLAEALNQFEANLRSEGQKTYRIPPGGTGLPGDLGYALAFGEIVMQSRSLGIEMDHLIAPVGSQGTFCGLLLGRKIMRAQTDLIGIATSPADTCRRAGLPNITEMYQAAAAYVGLDASFSPGDFKVFYDYVGSGYGQISPEGLEAIKLLARKEGVLLDPIYSGKVMAGLIDLIRTGLFSKKDNVVFIHTGALGGLLSHALYIP